MSAERSSDWDVIIIGGGIAGASLGAEIASSEKINFQAKEKSVS